MIRPWNRSDQRTKLKSRDNHREKCIHVLMGARVKKCKLWKFGCVVLVTCNTKTCVGRSVIFNGICFGMGIDGLACDEKVSGRENPD